MPTFELKIFRDFPTGTSASLFGWFKNLLLKKLSKLKDSQTTKRHALFYEGYTQFLFHLDLIYYSLI